MGSRTRLYDSVTAPHINASICTVRHVNLDDCLKVTPFLTLLCWSLYIFAGSLNSDARHGFLVRLMSEQAYNFPQQPRNLSTSLINKKCLQNGSLAYCEEI